MDLNFLEQKLNKYENPKGRLSVLFVNKTGINYESFRPSVSNNVQLEIVKLLKETVQYKRNSNLAAVSFNPSGHESDQYSVCNTDYVGNYQEVINLFDESNETEMLVDKISFIVFRLRINEDSEEQKFLYFYRKNHKLKSIRKGFWMRKIDKTFNILENDELVAIDGEIDAVSFNDKLLFFNHISAERIFNLREKFKENALSVLEQVKTGDRINNYEVFKEDCLDNARVVRRLTKIQSDSRIIDLFHSHFDNAPEVAELFDLNISFNKDKTKIIYEDKSQLTDITLLMRDAYYRTVLANRKGMDDFN
ncbi:Kiwa anti-phage protein KwaB-like domain-containing protein [Oceanobacillus kimchii]|uniref:Kiwa anti-phage protein KwaB-like domain-containing protein n=1 Tax=Oceanobacillus kimchii TaxID=746691 RepID=UPI00232EF0C1|nr:Kiwa anti-phage protein KwaB-like domain-containing protein [Oceanobacillus kimchii]